MAEGVGPTDECSSPKGLSMGISISWPSSVRTSPGPKDDAASGDRRDGRDIKFELFGRKPSPVKGVVGLDEGAKMTSALATPKTRTLEFGVMI